MTVQITDEQLAAHRLTREQYNELSKPEQEALTIEEDASAHQELTDDDLDAAAAVAGEDDDDKAKAKPEGGEDGAKAKPDDKAAAKAEPAEKPEFVPMPAGPTPEQVAAAEADFAARAQQIAAAEKAVDEKMDALDKQLEDGEITTVEHSKAKRGLDKEAAKVAREQAALEADQRIHKARVADSQQAAASVMEQRYSYAQTEFFGDDANALYKHDKLGKQAKDLLLQQFVPALAKMPENANRTFGWFLAEGDKRVRAFMAEEIAAAGLGTSKKATGGARPPKLDTLPPTLRSAPQADNENMGGEFDELLALDGEAYTRALERLTPQQRARFEELQ